VMQKNLWRPFKTSLLLAAIGLQFQACDNAETTENLPLLGPYMVEDRVVDGVIKTDTVFTTIRPFTFFDQDSNEITHATIEGKVYVTDFFFTSCPTICPKMKQQLLRVAEEFQSENDFLILSHSIDPKRDSVQRLHNFAEKLGVESAKWHLMTGNRDSIYSMAKHYMIAAQKDDLAPGGYAHSGAFLVVDKNKQIRGIYDGTLPEDVDKMMLDIKRLMKNGGI
jgi:protein SCO1/2